MIMRFMKDIKIVFKITNRHRSAYRLKVKKTIEKYPLLNLCDQLEFEGEDNYVNRNYLEHVEHQKKCRNKLANEWRESRKLLFSQPNFKEIYRF